MTETDTGDIRQWRLGEQVWVPSLKSEGEISEISESELEILVGRLRIRAKPNEVERLTKKERQHKTRKKKLTYNPDIVVPDRPTSPGLELDLRGSRVDDALPRVDEYLNAAYLSDLPFVRIIHGKGTGALRTAIRSNLRQHPLVAKHASGLKKRAVMVSQLFILYPKAN